jgi:curved DNA-binding protein CbpA
MYMQNKKEIEFLSGAYIKLRMPDRNKEERRFRRYRRNLDLTITIRGKPLRARTINYSLEGMSVVIEGSHLINQGDILNIDTETLGLHQSGKVIWTKQLKNATLIGMTRIGPLKGSLRDYRLSDILIGIQRSIKTGTLEFKKGPVLKKVFIKEGDIVFSSSNQEADGLADMFVSEGRINRKQCEEAKESMRKIGKTEGAALVGLGLLKPPELFHAVTRQAEKIIEGLFAAEDMEFVFIESPLPSKEVIKLKLSAANAIYRGVKNTASEEALAEACPKESIIGFSPNPIDLFQDIRLEEKDKKILSYIDGRMNIGEIVRLLPFDEKSALKSIYALLETRIIEIKSKAESITDISAEEILERAGKDAVLDMTARIEDIYARYNELGYYGVLGIKDTATLDMIKKAYYRAAKEFHPDLHFRLPEETKGKLHEIFSFITNAYATLTDPGKRREYDTSLRERPHKAQSSADIASIKFDEGMAYIKKNDFENAAQLFAEAAYLDGSEPKFHHHYGVALSRLGKLKEAERALARALKGDSNNPDILSELGHVYLKLGFALRAKGNFEKALAMDPSHKKAKEGLEMTKE